MPWQLLDHTADAALEVRAAGRDELFAEALRALAATMTGGGRVEARQARWIELQAPAVDLLLVDWLNELVGIFDAEDLLFSVAEVAITDEELGGDPLFRLRAEIRGEPRDPKRHPQGLVVKGVTYHRLEVARGDDGGWWARVVLDI